MKKTAKTADVLALDAEGTLIEVGDTVQDAMLLPHEVKCIEAQHGCIAWLVDTDGRRLVPCLTWVLPDGDVA